MFANIHINPHIIKNTPVYMYRPLPPTPPPISKTYDVRECGTFNNKIPELLNAMHSFRIDLQAIMDKIDNKLTQLETRIIRIEDKLNHQTPVLSPIVYQEASSSNLPTVP